MAGPLRRIDRWWYAPMPAARLATLRVCVGGFALVYLLVRLFHLNGYAGFAASSFEPVGLLAPLAQPPAPLLVHLLYLATVGVAVAFTAGWRFRVSGPAFAVLFLVVTTYGSSWGMIFHTENLLALHLIVLGCSPAADARGLDARRRAEPVAEDGRHGWPVRLMCLIAVATYFLAGLAKLKVAGIDWALGGSLREQIAWNGLRKLAFGEPAPLLAEALVRHAWCFPPLAWGTLAFEVGAPLALASRAATRLWVAIAWGFHLGVLLAMSIAFVYPLTGVAFLCFFEVEKLDPIRWWRRSRFGGLRPHRCRNRRRPR